MHPSPLRRIATSGARWLVAMISVVLIALAVASPFVGVVATCNYGGRMYAAMMHHGTAHFRLSWGGVIPQLPDFAELGATTLLLDRPGLEWRLAWAPAPTSHNLFIPMPLLVVPPLAGTAVLWRRPLRLAHRRRRGLCLACGFDRQGTPGGPCPECGAV